MATTRRRMPRRGAGTVRRRGGSETEDAPLLPGNTSSRRGAKIVPEDGVKDFRDFHTTDDDWQGKLYVTKQHKLSRRLFWLMPRKTKAFIAERVQDWLRHRVKYVTCVLNNENNKYYLIAIDQGDDDKAYEIYFKVFPMKLCGESTRLVKRHNFYKEQLFKVAKLFSIAGITATATSGSLAAIGAFITGAAYPLLATVGVTYGLIHMLQPDLDEETGQYEQATRSKFEQLVLHNKYIKAFREKIVKDPWVGSVSEDTKKTLTHAQTIDLLTRAMNHDRRHSSTKSHTTRSLSSNRGHGELTRVRSRSSSRMVLKKQTETEITPGKNHKKHAPTIIKSLDLWTSWDGKICCRGESWKVEDNKFYIDQGEGLQELGTFIGWDLTRESKYSRCLPKK